MGLVGKKFNTVSKDKMQLYMRLLYQIRMGYVDVNEPTAHQSIKYYPEEHLYDHDLSICSIGRDYEIKKLRDLVPLDFYVNTPIELTEELIRGMMMGVEDRSKMEREAVERRDQEKAMVTQQTGESFNQLHNHNEE